MTFAAFREDIRNEIMLQRLREHEVDSKIQITEAEIDTYLAAERRCAGRASRKSTSPRSWCASPKTPRPSRSPRAARAPRKSLRQLRTGADFAKRGRNLFRRGGRAARAARSAGATPDRLPQIFADAHRRLGAGHEPPVIKSANGFHILQAGRTAHVHARQGRRAGGGSASRPMRATS